MLIEKIKKAIKDADYCRVDQYIEMQFGLLAPTDQPFEPAEKLLIILFIQNQKQFLDAVLSGAEADLAVLHPALRDFYQVDLFPTSRQNYINMIYKDTVSFIKTDVPIELQNEIKHYFEGYLLSHVIFPAVNKQIEQLQTYTTFEPMSGLSDKYFDLEHLPLLEGLTGDFRDPRIIAVLMTLDPLLVNKFMLSDLLRYYLFQYCNFQTMPHEDVYQLQKLSEKSHDEMMASFKRDLAQYIQYKGYIPEHDESGRTRFRSKSGICSFMWEDNEALNFTTQFFRLSSIHALYVSIENNLYLIGFPLLYGDESNKHLYPICMRFREVYIEHYSKPVKNLSQSDQTIISALLNPSIYHKLSRRHFHDLYQHNPGLVTQLLKAVVPFYGPRFESDLYIKEGVQTLYEAQLRRALKQSVLTQTPTSDSDASPKAGRRQIYFDNDHMDAIFKGIWASNAPYALKMQLEKRLGKKPAFYTVNDPNDRNKHILTIADELIPHIQLSPDPKRGYDDSEDLLSNKIREPLAALLGVPALDIKRRYDFVEEKMDVLNKAILRSVELLRDNFKASGSGVRKGCRR